MASMKLSSTYSQVPYNHFEQSSLPLGRRMDLEICATALHGVLSESKVPKICQVTHLDKLINYLFTMLILFTHPVRIY